jgi:putative ATPase
MPEGRFHLGMAALHLATAPKSNSVFAFFDALASVEREEDSEVPNHLRDASRDKESFGHGKGYLYPHAYQDHWVAQQYLPHSLQGKVFYQPGSLGHENRVRNEVLKRREAQLAAVLDAERVEAQGETLTFSPMESKFETWLERSMGGTAHRLERIREGLFRLAQCSRHHTVLVLNDDPGLLVWEALRQVPEGGVWCQVNQQDSIERMRAQAADFPDLRKPHFVATADGGPAELLRQLESDLRFDRLIGRNLLRGDKWTAPGLHRLAGLLPSGGRLLCAETLPEEGQRLHRILPLEGVGDDLRQRIAAAEEGGFTAGGGQPGGKERLESLVESAGLRVMRQETLHLESPVVVTRALLDRWFGPPGSPASGTYSCVLSEGLAQGEIDQLAATARAALAGRTVTWQSATVLLAAEPSSRAPERQREAR